MTFALCLLHSRGLAAEPVSDIKSDEVVELLPTYAYYDSAAGEYVVSIRAWVYEPSEGSLTARLFWKALGLDAALDENRIFKQRASRFMVDSENGKRVAIRLDGQSHDLGKTGDNGHVVATMRVKKLSTAAGPLATQAVLRPGDMRGPFVGRVHVVPPEGISVISDIDDTIKISQVRDKKALVANTFLNEFKPVPGLASVYQAWAKRGAAFHYVTASPWQLFVPLDTFRDKAGFPAGTFHMKDFQFTSPAALFASPTNYKREKIEPILRAFPKRRFVLVGDSGEKDPEIYGELARRFPDQVAKIFVRDVTDEAADAPRYAEALKDVARERWAIFRRPQEIAEYRP